MSTHGASNKYAASVHVYSAEEYQGMRLLMTEDGMSGVSLRDDEIVSAFSSPQSPNKHVARCLLENSVRNGGRRLDCFDTVLPGMYAQGGFVETARLKWDDNYQPDGWDKETFVKFNGGEPDVVFMAYEPDPAKRAEVGRAPYVEDYDAGTASSRAYSAGWDQKEP